MGNNAGKLQYGMEAVLPLLVVPIAVCSLAKLVYHAWRDKRYKESLPLIVVEINTVFIWVCQGYAL